MSKKRHWQIVAAIVIIIGIILVMATAQISGLIPDCICILFVILGVLLVAIGTSSWSILQFYY